MDRPAKRKTRKGYIRIVLIVLILIFSIRAVAGVRSNTIETALVEHGSISLYQQASGVVVRTEKLVNSPITGYISNIADENIRLPANQRVLEVKSDKVDDSSLERYKQINDRLQALEQTDASIRAEVDEEVIKKGLKNIGLLIDQQNFSAVYQQKEKLNRDINYGIAANTTQSEREQLLKEKNRLDEIIEGGIREVVSPFPGIPVYSLDGYEEVLCPENVQEIVPSKVQPKSIKRVDLSGKVEAGLPVLKIVDNHVWYIVCEVSKEFAEGMEKGAKISLEVLGEEPRTIAARVYSIHEQDQGFRIVFNSGDFFPGLYQRRVIELNVIKAKHSGLLIPSAALHQRDGGYYVEVLDGEKVIIKEVSVKVDDGANAVVENSDTGSELKIYDMVIIRN